MLEEKNKEWFCEWFNTPYYHILYKSRNSDEAELFIDNLLNAINISKAGRVVDIACGKGRHSIYLNKKGYDVHGIDISEESIMCAKKFENNLLHFSVHDMRKSFITNYFDVALNLFTSFGYFNRTYENELALRTMHLSIKKNGYLIIDFLNSEKVLQSTVETESKVVDGITFSIKRGIEKNRLVKHISFTVDKKTHNYSESVQLLTLTDFENYFERVGLKIVNLFGDYSLNPFDPMISTRLIIVGIKL